MNNEKMIDALRTVVDYVHENNAIGTGYTQGTDVLEAADILQTYLNQFDNITNV